MGEEDAASRTEAARFEQEGDRLAAAGAFDRAREFYREAQRTLMPTGRMFSDAEEYDLRMAGFQRVQEKLWALASGAPVRPSAPPPQPSAPPLPERPASPPRFGTSAAALALDRSLDIGYEQWHDGIGYDLDALRAMGADERQAAEAWLVRRVASREAGWREVEALAALRSEASRAALRRALETGDLETRLHAAETLSALGDAVAVDEVIVEVLRRGGFANGLSRAIDLIPAHDSPLIRSALLDLARTGDQTVRVHAAAMLFYLAGLADAPFDLGQRPFFLQFGEADAATRERAFAELARRLATAPGSPRNN